MANGWNSGSDRDAMLRRVAIVLSSLPASVASQLMGGIDAETQQDVRRTMASLTDVDPLERKRALHAFKVSVQQPDSPDVYQSSSTRVEDATLSSPNRSVNSYSGSRVVPAEESGFARVAASEPTTSETSPLAFLGSVDDESLFQLLATEHPQTVALVLASISPDQAARILPRLDVGVQQNALSRIGRLGEIPETAIAEVAAHFRDCLSKQSTSERNALGRRALDAILAAMPADRPATTQREATWTAGHDQQSTSSGRHPEAIAGQNHSGTFPSAERAAETLSARLRNVQSHAQSPPIRDSFTVGGSPNSSGTQGRRSADRGEVVSESRLRVAPNTRGQESHRQSSHSRKTAEVKLQHTSNFSSTDAIHRHLVQLSPQCLCETLGRVDTRVAMLALCGLPNHVTDAVMAVLPRAQAKEVRQRMNSLGSLQLREIDQAKEAVAEASLTVASSTVPVAA